MIYDPPPSQDLARYLCERVEDASEVEVTEVLRSWPGMSRETWFVRAQLSAGGSASERRYVFRMDPPGGGFGFNTVGYEARVYEMLQETKIPVQPFLWREPAGNDWLPDGREFFVRSWVDGTVQPENLHNPNPKYDGVRERIVKHHIERLVDIHALDWKTLGFGEFAPYVPDSAETALEAEIEFHLEQSQQHVIGVRPAVTEAMLCLREHLPAPSSRVVMRKENNGIGEEIWQGETIVAMSDWETASLGAPELDLAVAARNTLHLWNTERALDYYEQISGYEINREAIAFYTNMWSMKVTLGIVGALPSFSRGEDYRLQVATLGIWGDSLKSSLAELTGF